MGWKVLFVSQAWSNFTHCMMASKEFASNSQRSEAGSCLKARKSFEEGMT